MKQNQDKKMTNEDLLLEIYKSTERTRKYILFGRIISLVYLLIVLVPLVVAIIYLPPFFSKFGSQYDQALELLDINLEQPGGTIVPENSNLEEILETYQKYK